MSPCCRRIHPKTRWSATWNSILDNMKEMEVYKNLSPITAI